MRRVLPVLLLGACVTVPKTAMVDGREVPRLTLQLTGQPYAVEHQGAHPRPGSPSGGLRDAGGSIRGRVCGLLVDFDVTHKGDHVQLVGSIDNKFPASIGVSEDRGVRHFSGNLGNLGVDFLLAPETMQGHVGVRVFALDISGDSYQGYMRAPGIMTIYDEKQRSPVMVRGREALWAMPAADQAAVLPALMTCDGTQFRNGNLLSVGLGGEAGDRAPETSTIYTRGGV